MFELLARNPEDGRITVSNWAIVVAPEATVGPAVFNATAKQGVSFAPVCLSICLTA